jgi:hypothetical protein
MERTTLVLPSNLVDYVRAMRNTWELAGSDEVTLRGKKEVDLLRVCRLELAFESPSKDSDMSVEAPFYFY